MTEAEIANRLSGLLGTYGGNNPSAIDQFRNANLGMTWLNAMGPDAIGDQYNAYASQMKGMMGNAVASGVGSLLGGAVNIGSEVSQLSGINDTQRQEQEIGGLRSIGTSNYGSFDQMMSDYTRLVNSKPDINYDDIRGSSVGEQVGGVISSTMSGVTTGLSVGGPWGALAGGVIGLGAGLGGVFSGNAEARAKENQLKLKADIATRDASQNLNNAGERLNEYKFRSGVGNIAASGGRINRRDEPSQVFANRVLKKPRRATDTTMISAVRSKCKGGVMVRIK